ncbi:hypothetical protein [Candidatus Nitrososphaera gargensis]|uniref:hypothetical protein n=1 Tax=Candidatus Nitrososphaera gargensis TaxID=497727 RepID=UPI001650866D|nr:hypothetical protein [Candidatus Nitrososphaera gargensis]
MEDRQAPAGSSRGRGPLMIIMMIDYYTIAALAAVALAAALVGFRLAKDEMLLRRKTLVEQQ